MHEDGTLGVYSTYRAVQDVDSSPAVAPREVDWEVPEISGSSGPNQAAAEAAEGDPSDETSDAEFEKEMQDLRDSFQASTVKADRGQLPSLGETPTKVDSGVDDEELHRDDIDDMIYNDIMKDSGAVPVTMADIRKSIGADREDWKLAMDNEVCALLNEAMEVLPAAEAARVDPKKVLPMKIVATLKPTDVESVKRKKVRGVVCGNFQPKHKQEALYTSNTDITSVRTLLAVSAKMGWGLTVIDVTTAFLNAALPEEEGDVFVRPPKILSEFGLVPEGSIWRARRAVYGLRVAPRSWGIHRDRELRKLRITVGGRQCRLAQSHVDPAMWAIIEDGPHKLSHQVQPLGYLLSYVDDFLIAADTAVRQALCTVLESTWTCKRTGEVRYKSTDEAVYLSATIQGTSDGAYLLHQQRFIEDLLKCWSMDSCRPSTTPGSDDLLKAVSDASLQEEENQPDISDVRQAQKLAGSLIWVATRTRPDISYAQSAVSSLATRDPLRALALGKRVLRYLAGTRDVALVFRPDGADFTAYGDASFEAHRSTTGSVVTYCGCVLAWRSSKQPQVARSTADSEVTALAATVSLAENVRALLESMYIPVQCMNIGCDNQACIVLSTGEGSSKTKSLMNRTYYIKELVQLKQVQLFYVSTDMQVADCLTKFLAAVKYGNARQLLSLTRLQ